MLLLDLDLALLEDEDEDGFEDDLERDEVSCGRTGVLYVGSHPHRSVSGNARTLGVRARGVIGRVHLGGRAAMLVLLIDACP